MAWIQIKAGPYSSEEAAICAEDSIYEQQPSAQYQTETRIQSSLTLDCSGLEYWVIGKFYQRQTTYGS